MYSPIAQRTAKLKLRNAPTLRDAASVSKALLLAMRIVETFRDRCARLTASSSSIAIRISVSPNSVAMPTKPAVPKTASLLVGLYNASYSALRRSLLWKDDHRRADIRPILLVVPGRANENPVKKARYRKGQHSAIAKGDRPSGSHWLASPKLRQARKEPFSTLEKSFSERDDRLARLFQGEKRSPAKIASPTRRRISSFGTGETLSQRTKTLPITNGQRKKPQLWRDHKRLWRLLIACPF